MSKIEWTDATLNVAVGCSRVSEGCRHCFAERVVHRQMQPAHRGLTVVSPDKGPRWNGTVRLMPERLATPLRWRKPRRVFVGSLMDLFHPDIPNEYRAAVFGVMAATPHITYQVLTKRDPRPFFEWVTPEKVDTYKHVALAGRIEEVFAEERTAPIQGWPGYFITSKGRVFTNRGSDTCVWCGAPTNGKIARRKYCSRKCKARAEYEAKMGRWSPPQTMTEMKTTPGSAGHLSVSVYARDGAQERLLVHRLVLEHFDRPPKDGEQCCHIDGDPTNNALWNLRWGDQKSNWDDSKRHGTRRRYFKLTDEQVAQIRRARERGETAASIAERYGVSDTTVLDVERGRTWSPEYEPEWPLRNVWLLVSCEDQRTFDERTAWLRECPAAVRGVSYEPALGPIRLGEVGRWLDWLIAGSESGPRARPAEWDWFRSLRDQCVEAGVSYFFKQWAENGRKVSTPELDGQRWMQFP